MKVLCICPIGIGNYLLVYPACAAIRKIRPDSELHLLGLRKGIGDFAQDDPLWSGITVFDPTGKTASLRKMAGVIMSLRRKKFDASLSFFPSNKWLYNLLPVLAGIPERFGFEYLQPSSLSLSFLCTKKRRVDAGLHDVQQNMNLASLFTGSETRLDAEPAFPVLFGREETTWASEFLNSCGSGPYVALHAGSSGDHGMHHKRWAPERFALLADKICGRLGAVCVILGGNDEASVKKTVAKAMKEKAVILPQVSLGKTAAILNLCRLCLCNDSGIMHIASCSGVPTIAIFGPTDERRNGPAGRLSLVVRKPMPGFPVWNAVNVGSRKLPCGIDPAASLKALSADEAWDQVLPWLEKHIMPGI